ncbi:MAG TPA: glycosyltransferase family 4 protein [Gaiellaceae bacterium]
MRLVFVTQRVDVDDPALGATVAKIRALASLVDELVVLALDARPTELPTNVRVRTFGGGSRVGRTLRLVTALVRERPTAVVAHMAPVYAVLAAVVTKPRRVPLLLWFTHWRGSHLLRLAERLSTRVLSVDERSFPLRSRKVVAVGHGITIGPPAPPRPDDGVLRLLAVGRTSPAKGLEAIAAAVERVPATELVVVGPSLTDEERRHRNELRSLGVRVEEPVPHGRIGEVYATADAVVNNMRAGALDKVVFEAAAAGLPVLVASDGFAGLVAGIDPPLRFVQDDPSSIAARVEGIAAIGADRRRAIGAELRERVQRDHSVERWAERVVEAAR